MFYILIFKHLPIKNLKLKTKNYLVVILGPTASGKSALAVQLARKFKGEIISADSRQVYKGLDIGSGKITKREMMGIPHHLLDVASPKRRFTVAQYRCRAIEAIASIVRQGKLPILAGGSPFYVYALTDGWTIPEVKPDQKLRKKLEKISTEQLFQKLQTLDPSRSKTIETKNRRRLIRALEIVMKTGRPIPPLKKYPLPRLRPLDFARGFGGQAYPVLFIGIKRSREDLKKRIQKRVAVMFKQGLLQEVKKLRSSGLSWNRIEEFGFEYRFIASYLRNTRVRTLQEELKAKIQKATEDFARRQMSWFKKDSRIHWIKSSQEAKTLIRHFLLGLAK